LTPATLKQVGKILVALSGRLDQESTPTETTPYLKQNYQSVFTEDIYLNALSNYFMENSVDQCPVMFTVLLANLRHSKINASFISDLGDSAAMIIQWEVENKQKVGIAAKEVQVHECTHNPLLQQ